MAGRKPANPPRRISGFDEANKYESCPDCNLREALTRTLQRPIHDHDSFRRRAHKRGRVIGIHFPPGKVDGCETCNGTGQVPRLKPGDPYDRDAMYPVETAKRKKAKKRKKK